MIRWKVPLYKILVDKDDTKNITNVIQRGMHWAEGPEIIEFEIEYVEFESHIPPPKVEAVLPTISILSRIGLEFRIAKPPP